MNIPSDLGPIPPYSSELLGIPKELLVPYVPNGSIGTKTSPNEFWDNIKALKDQEFDVTPVHKFELRFEECENKEEVVERFLSLLGDKLALQLDEQSSLSDVYEAVLKGVTENQDLVFTATLRRLLSISA